jgi:hypothetical protein
MTIIVNLRNFTLGHDIIILDGNNVEAQYKASIKDMPELVCELWSSYGCDKVILLGNKYAKGIENKIKNLFTAKYNCEKCPFEIECL